MCGLAGWLGDLPDAKEYADKMLRALYHRGPDDNGFRAWPDAGLIHTRLSIIDLSSAGAQPLSNETGTVWTVFNGEIYNHREIRENLERKGHTFKGHSDSEVLPHLYEEKGWEFVKYLRGMFALAVYDVRSRTMLLARDRFGIKPLFYAFSKRKRLSFASEINTLLNLPDIDLRPNRQAVFDFTALTFIPAPDTFYQGIRALQPGEVILASLDSHEVNHKSLTFHHWEIAPDFSLTLQHATDRAERLIDQAVRRQLESEVPLATLLSGGLDSSLVSCAAQAALGGSLQTFNVRFDDETYDETWAAVAVADHIGSRHQILEMVKGMGTWEYITGLLQYAGQPFADTSLFAVHAVCRLMREYVTVALSGDGGDEGFGGYDFYWQIARIASLQRLPPMVWNAVAYGLEALLWFGLVRPSLPCRIREFSRVDDVGILENMFCWIRQEEHKKLCKDEGLLPLRRWFEPKWDTKEMAGVPRVERLSAHATEMNIRLKLPNDYLFKVDSASMRESLEVRVPMLDEELMAFGLTLPHNLKVSGKTSKRVLRAVAERKLPPAVAAKSKWGFGLPVDRWVDEPFKQRLKEELLGVNSRLPEFFHPEVYKPVIEAFSESRPFAGISRQGLYQRAIMLLAVHLTGKTTGNPR
jgi:asparagine synthase (glutamine-hydrolysing)